MEKNWGDTPSATLNLILVYFCYSYFVIFFKGGANVVCNKHSGIIGI